MKGSNFLDLLTWCFFYLSTKVNHHDTTIWDIVFYMFRNVFPAPSEATFKTFYGKLVGRCQEIGPCAIRPMHIQVVATQTFLEFSPRNSGKEITHFDGRIFFKWVGEKPPASNLFNHFRGFSYLKWNGWNGSKPPTRHLKTPGDWAFLSNNTGFPAIPPLGKFPSAQRKIQANVGGPQKPDISMGLSLGCFQK